jgi:hypothetical protein
MDRPAEPENPDNSLHSAIFLQTVQFAVPSPGNSTAATAVRRRHAAGKVCRIGSF